MELDKEDILNQKFSNLQTFLGYILTTRQQMIKELNLYLNNSEYL